MSIGSHCNEDESHFVKLMPGKVSPKALLVPSSLDVQYPLLFNSEIFPEQQLSAVLGMCVWHGGSATWTALLLLKPSYILGSSKAPQPYSVHFVEEQELHAKKTVSFYCTVRFCYRK